MGVIVRVEVSTGQAGGPNSGYSALSLIPRSHMLVVPCRSYNELHRPTLEKQLEYDWVHPKDQGSNRFVAQSVPPGPAHRPRPQTPPKAPPTSPPPPRPLPSGTAAVFGHPPIVSACSQSLPASYASPVGVHQVRTARVRRTKTIPV